MSEPNGAGAGTDAVREQDARAAQRLHDDQRLVERDVLLLGPRHEAIEVGLDDAARELAVVGREQRFADER